MWLSLLYIPWDSSIVSTKFFVLNLDGWFGVLSKKVTIMLISDHQ